MTRSTKLYQQPGSPLIQGHSKAERSFWGEWLRGLMLCLILGFGVYVYLGLDPNVAFGVSSLVEAARSTLVLFVPGAVVGTAVGIPVARGFGWRRLWLAAVCSGVLFGALSAYFMGMLGL